MGEIVVDSRGIKIPSTEEIRLVSGGDAVADTAGGEAALGGILMGAGAYYEIGAMVAFGFGFGAVGAVALIGYGIYEAYH